MVFLTYYTPICLWAQYFTGPVASGAGGAGRAGAEPGEVGILNPASLAHAPETSVNFYYDDGYTALREHKTTFGLSVVDNSKEVFFPGAISYFQRRLKSDGFNSVDEVYLQMSVGNFLYRQIAMGFSIIHLDQDVYRKETHEQWNGIVGFHYNPNPDFGLAFVYYHFAKPGAGVPAHLELLPQSSLGLNFIVTDFFRFRLDVSKLDKYNPENKLKYQTGLESFMNNFFVLRVGTEIDEVSKRNFLTAGFTFNSPKFKLDYAFVKNQKDISEALHSVDIRAPF